MSQIDHFLDLNNIQNARKAIKESGFYLVENAYPQEFCRSVIEFMNNHKNDNQIENKKFAGTEMNYAGTELRVWEAHKKDPLLQRFYQECNLTMSSLLRKDVEAFTVLAIKNQMIDPFDESLKKGRWHIDSFLRQLKIFLFLSDTTEQSGPFEFIPKTHTKSFKLRRLCSGVYIKPADLLSGGKRAYQCLNDVWIDKLSANGFKPAPVICKAGTILIIDTSAIHRARPCIQGSRYALTTYFR